MTLFPTYNRFDVKVQSGAGATITDTNGKKYLDFGSGIGVCNLGHTHPTVKKAVEQQLDQYWHVSNLYHLPIQEEVAQLIVDHSFADQVFFANSGAEANEAAIKLVRKATSKNKIISFEKSFHGRTFATMAATGQEKIREGYGDMLPEFAYATFNDIESVKNLIDDETAAVMLELVQGEGGVRPADKDFIQQLASLCQSNNVLLVVDEIQTGIGRTGKGFAYEHYGVTPDVMTLAKGLGNGIPVGAMVAKKELKEVFHAGTHGTTFGGNPIAMAAAKAVMTEVFAEEFLQEVQEKSNYLNEKLTEHLAPIEIVQGIRQQGLMVGIECDKAVIGFVKTLLEEGLMVLVAGENVLRLLPPLIVTEAEIDEAVKKLTKVLSESVGNR